MLTLNKIPKNTFTLPTSTDTTLMPFWTIEQQNQYFMLQKSQEPGNTLFKSVLSTITNLFDAKQPPYRILFQRESNATCLQIAVSDSEEAIEAAWNWINNMLPVLENISGSYAKEEWIIIQMNMIVSSTLTNNDTDDLLHDDIIRNASRTFRQTFDVSSSERLVNYYSCACNGRQGWMYISENYLAFYSYLLGFELKILVELKDIKDIFKEPIKKLLRRELRVTTKDDREYFFSNMFKRDEVYELLVQLTGDSIHRLLKNSNSSAFKSGDHLSISPSNTATQGRRFSASHSTTNNNPLKNVLQYRKKNEQFRQLFRLPDDEEVIDEISVHYMFETEPNTSSIHPGTLIKKNVYPGTLYQSQNYLTFQSTEITSLTETGKSYYSFILPLYTIIRFERINSGTYKSALSFKTWHKRIHLLEVDAEKTACEKFCDLLKNGLETNAVKMKRSLRGFLETCKSEELLEAKDSIIHVKKPIGGLGLQFGYRSDTTDEKDGKKLQSWIKYFHENGRNITLGRQPYIFAKMVRIGSPNALRGEIWEICSGSIYLRFDNQGIYNDILQAHKNDASPAKEDIEKDLHRSLPEYAAYQSAEGIDGLRRVLTAYSWKNPEIGYCQAMNIVTSSLLIHMTEEQAFWTLNTLVDHLCPGYYSSSMYGVLLDQMVLEELTKIYLPKITDNLKEKDIHLSVTCLPWFLTLFINSMPLPFAFRILDCFFLEGPKILFQIALAVLKTNEQDLCKIQDDSELLVVSKTFFASLNLTADGTADENYANKLAIFTDLMKCAYGNFSLVTSDKIIQLRKENELKIIGGVESFTKRNALRSIKNTAHFSSEEISNIYDYFFGALYYAISKNDNNSNSEQSTEMDLTAFTNMLENMTTWAKVSGSNDMNKSVTFNQSENMQVIHEISQSFISRLFNHFKCNDCCTGVTLSDTVSKLGEILRGDIMSKTSFYFFLYNNDKSEKLNNVDLHTMTTEFFWLMNTLEVEFDAWDTICNFIGLCIEQGNSKEVVNEVLEVLHQLDNGPPPDDSTWFANHVLIIHNTLMGPGAPPIEITLPVLRMIVFTNDHLDQFIQTILPKSFKLEKAHAERQKGLGYEIFEALFVEGRKLATNMSLTVPPPTESANSGIYLSPSYNNSSEKRRSFSNPGSPRLSSYSSLTTSSSIKSTSISQNMNDTDAAAVADEVDNKKPSKSEEEEDDDYEIV